MLNISRDYFPKKYEIPLFISFIIAARSTESIVRKALIAYYPNFYEEYKLYIFGFSLLVVLLIVYYVNRHNKRKKASITEA